MGNNEFTQEVVDKLYTYKDINKINLSVFDKEIVENITIPNKCDMNYNTFELNSNDLSIDYCNVEKNKHELQFLLNEVSKDVKLSKIVDMDQIRNDYIKSINKLKFGNSIDKDNSSDSNNNQYTPKKSNLEENIDCDHSLRSSSKEVNDSTSNLNPSTKDEILNLKNDILSLLEKRNIK